MNSIALVKPDKAKSVEMMLIRMAQTGQIAGKVMLPLIHTMCYSMDDALMLGCSVGRRESTGGITREIQPTDTEEDYSEGTAKVHFHPPTFHLKYFPSSLNEDAMIQMKSCRQWILTHSK